jgi:hypothetical protein
VRYHLAAGGEKRRPVGPRPCPKEFRPVLPVGGMGIDIDRRDDTVTGADVGQIIVQHVVGAGRVVQVEVGVDDGICGSKIASSRPARRLFKTSPARLKGGHADRRLTIAEMSRLNAATT